MDALALFDQLDANVSKHQAAIDLFYEDGIRFSDGYIQRFESAYSEALDENTHYNPMTGLRRQRAFTAASQLVGNDVSTDRALEVAEAVGAPYFLVPRIEIENSRNYRITVTFGVTAEGESGFQIHTSTSNRRVDTVESRLQDLTEEALAIPPVE